MLAYCTECGEEFERDESEWWKRLCYDCWRQERIDAGEWLGRIPSKRPRKSPREVELEQENDRLHRLFINATERIDRLLQELDALRELASIVDNNIDFLVFATHPDRNPSRPEEAHITCQHLIEVRKAIKRRNPC